MDTAYLGLGSNVGDRRAHLQTAVEGLQRRSGLRVEVVSPVYETEAHTWEAGETQPSFLNAVVEVETTSSPEHLLRIAQVLEREAGRAPTEEAWAPRPLDVDLLAVDDLTRRSDVLTLPHPRLAERRFVLRPWADLAPTFEVPQPFDASVEALLRACSDTAAIRRTEIRLSIPSSSPKAHGADPRE